MPAESFPDLMGKLKTGDAAAASLVFDRFAQQVLALARRRLQAGVAARVDPEDVLQSVFRSFFVRQREGHFVIDNWESLWGILMTMTARKCGRRVQHHRAGKRDAAMEVPYSSALEDEGHAGLFAREPSPSEAVALIELVGNLMCWLPEEDREILTLHLQGHTIAEIKAHTGRAMRTIRRVLERVRERARALAARE